MVPFLKSEKRDWYRSCWPNCSFFRKQKGCQAKGTERVAPTIMRNLEQEKVELSGQGYFEFNLLRSGALTGWKIVTDYLDDESHFRSG